MKGEINRDWYCAGGWHTNEAGVWNRDCVKSYLRAYSSSCAGTCHSAHRKWPTPEQFKEEYGEEYPDDAPVFVWYGHGTTTGWSLMSYFEAKKYDQFGSVVCACTPWGKPPNDWRPE